MLLVTICVMLNAQTGEEMLRRAISTNPTNSFSDGSKQKGQWTTSNNMSAYLYTDGLMFFGNFIGNKRHGHGIMIASEGYYINNCPNAKYHVGNWSYDQKSGTGSCYDASGKLLYNGDFKDDKPTGTYPTTSSNSSYKFETIDYTSGDKYVGETKDGKTHGYGVYAWKAGRIWIGWWKEGSRAGQGIDIASDGSLLTGYWDNNGTRSSTPTVASGSSGSYSPPAVVPIIPAPINPYSSGSGSNASRVQCRSCNGTGRCNACNGNYILGNCTYCNGVGKKTYGTGRNATYETCTACKGSGKRECSICADITTNRWNYHPGKCGVCKGSGYIN